MKGFIILAQNSDIDYVTCAEVLANSIRKTMPNSSITLLTNDITSSGYFDNIIELPYGDKGGMSNDWQVYDASPYEYTIKLEADMFLPSSIDYWWDTLMNRDLVVCNTIRNFKQEISPAMHYREFIYMNNLPNVYNAITYFKKSDNAEYFYKLVRNIFENWEDYKKILKCDNDEPATTDWVYAIACHIVGIEKTTLPNFTQMSMVHMKQYINNTAHIDWTKELVYECNDTLKINTFPQRYPFHYYIKDFAKELKANYG